MLEINWLGHSTFELKLENGEVIVTDPWVDGNPKHPENYQFEKIDTIIVSHGHFDHVNDLVRLAKQYEPDIVAIYEICQWLDHQGVKNTQKMNKGGTVKVKSVKYTMTEALHSSCFVDDTKISCAGEPVGYVLHLPDGRRAYFAGDTSIFSDMALIQQLYQPEIAFLPIGDVFTMGPEQAALACRLLKAKTVIPMHYGTFPQLTGTPERLKELLQGEQNVQVVTLEAGKPQQI